MLATLESGLTPRGIAFPRNDFSKLTGNLQERFSPLRGSLNLFIAYLAKNP